MVRVFKKANFNVYTDFNGEYIIHNMHKPFASGHTHIKEFSTAKYLINLAHHRSLPNRNLKYFIESLMRISDDEKYIRKLQELSKTRLKKKRSS